MDHRRCHHHAGEFVADVVLWRRGRADLSALLLAAAVASWILFFHGASGYTAVSLAADVLLLLLAVLYAWSRAARLLGRPAPPIPDLQPAAEELAALVRSGLAGLASAFRRVAQGQPGSGRVFACLAAAALLGRVARDLPTLCYAVVVGGLTIPAVYQRLSMERYMRLASLNLYRYEVLYQSFSLTCYLSARDYLVELLKEP
ncbi:hypothetical protein CFC21_009558 [Triticum aestivum]|uniref:Reticulon domain-containing protein n=3 Tax=Triticum TaxID=4564 RepID=A0A9R0R8S9_TRITD|nr:reticulon-like protein B12 [Triticum dicoccoides]XP_044425909.1 reticulon-like protein B12 [Triticum aestivum]KAF6992577.1 hypothetical protein CFC21_009558 [Triticum aestivum]VAH24062.1 unnamed protein product [Triticum turgidum subsp. durum]